MKMDRTLTKIKWKIHTFFTLYFKFWRYFFKKNCKIQSHQIFYLFLFLLAFISAGFIFIKILELHSKISEKNVFITNFSLLTDSLRQPPTPLTAKICQGWQKFSVDVPLVYCNVLSTIKLALFNHQTYQVMQYKI